MARHGAQDLSTGANERDGRYGNHSQSRCWLAGWQPWKLFSRCAHASNGRGGGNSSKLEVVQIKNKEIYIHIYKVENQPIRSIIYGQEFRGHIRQKERAETFRQALVVMLPGWRSC